MLYIIRKLIRYITKQVKRLSRELKSQFPTKVTLITKHFSRKLTETFCYIELLLKFQVMKVRGDEERVGGGGEVVGEGKWGKLS